MPGTTLGDNERDTFVFIASVCTSGSQAYKAYHAGVGRVQRRFGKRIALHFPRSEARQRHRHGRSRCLPPPAIRRCGTPQGQRAATLWHEWTNPLVFGFALHAVGQLRHKLGEPASAPRFEPRQWFSGRCAGSPPDVDQRLEAVGLHSRRGASVHGLTGAAGSPDNDALHSHADA